MTLRAQSGLNVEPTKPWKDEPHDLDRFVDELQLRFRLSTAENLSATQRFRPLSGETPICMIARFIMLAKPLEDEQPRVMTIDQLKTCYLHHLKSILIDAKVFELTRDVKAAERERDIYIWKRIIDTVLHSHPSPETMEDVIEQTKLRVVGLNRILVKDRLGDRPHHRLRDSSREKSPMIEGVNWKNKDRERRICNICKVRSHLAYGSKAYVSLGNFKRKGEIGVTKGEGVIVGYPTRSVGYRL